MLNCASIYAYEIDDPAIALEEIKNQLDEKLILLTHSVGIVMCHPEFISSGTLQYICENIPFDVVGMTTAVQAVNGEAGELILTIFVMTSDDVCFKTGVTERLDENIDTAIKTAAEKITWEYSETPGLAIVFAPCMSKYSGDAYVDSWQKTILNVPIFGAVATDDTRTYELSETICNGDSFKTEMSFVLCYGNINPRFMVGTFPHEKAMPHRGEITKSNGSLVYEINNTNAYKYFEGIGFTNNGVLAESYIFVPFAIDQKKRADYDGIPVIRSLNSFTEDGTAVFLGDVDEGSTFSLLTSEPDDVLSVTRQKIEQINSLSEVNGVLMFPCIARRMMTMRVAPLIELENVRDTIRPDIPFMMGYAGGEISPTLFKDGVPTNRFHNYSLIILAV